VDLGKTPSEASAVAMQTALTSLSPTSAIFTAINGQVASALSIPVALLTTAYSPSSVSFANSPFLSTNGGGAGAGAGSGSGNSGGGGNSTSAIIGVVLGVALVFFVAVWMWRSWAKHGKLPCFRDRGAEKRAALAAMAERNAGTVEGELTVRALASTVAALKAELAAKKALEIAERNAGGARDANLTVSPLAKARAEAAAEGAVAAAASEKRGQVAFAPTGAR